jgi:hypothetical protein
MTEQISWSRGWEIHMKFPEFLPVTCGCHVRPNPRDL